jgi:signal transduction histidine kinase/CheY-like chemotaxis protein
LFALFAAAVLGWALAPRIAAAYLPLLVVGAGAVALLVFALVTRGSPGAEAPGRPDDVARLESALAESARREKALEEDVRGLREAARLKDDFLATVAHELRTPLGAMLGWANVLREVDVDQATSTRALDAILRNARLQTRLISDLLDVSRIVAGTLRIDVQTVEPVSVIRAALETVRPTAEARGVTLTANVDAEAGPIAGDPSRLQQVLWNLLANAIKFTPEGGTVAVQARAVDGQIEVTVEDTGPGIPPAFLPHVFDRFRQAGGVKTPSKGGLGLGLAIARHLVELHQGAIAVANREPGPGAVFTLRLPQTALRAGEARPAPAVVEEAVPEGALPALDGLHVLVADEEEVREMAKAILSRRGARVSAVSSLHDIASALAELRPDVLVLDLEMAEAGPDPFIRGLRALPADKGGSTPAVALAAFGGADRTRALLAGFQLQLVKPVRPGELVAAVASLAGRTGKVVEAETATA